MNNKWQDSTNSTVEELDAEPEGDPKHSRRVEQLLGVGLVLLMMLFAGWNWWQGQRQIADYQAGGLAEAARDWDTAYNRFASAGDYADARTHASNAATYIAERDRQYRLATFAIGREDGVAALQALEAVDKIEDGYRDTARLRSEANTQIYQGALGGVIAMRTHADPTGLYYRTATDWVWLQGSDAESSLQNYDSGDYSVYDVPAQGGGRRLMAVRLNNGTPSFMPVALDAMGSIFWGQKGGWSYKNGCINTCARDMAYSVAGSTITVPVRSPGSDWIIAGLAWDGSKMLVADLDNETSEQPLMALYLAEPDGSKPALLFQDTGRLERAAFSQDGRYVILTVGFPDPNGATGHRAVVLDVSGKSPPRVISTVHDVGSGAPSGMDFVVLLGEASGKVALAQHDGSQTTLELIDLGSQKNDAQVLRVTQQLQRPMTAIRLDNGGVLVCGSTERASITLDPLNRNGGQCLMLDSKEHETRYNMPLLARYGLGNAWARAGSVIYPVAVPQGSGAELSLSILRIGASQAAASPPADATILQLGLGSGDRMNVVAGSSLLAYVAQGQLRVRTYDGSFDLLLEQGVERIYDLRSRVNNYSLF
ncbi:MAG: hypothetical protein ABI670_01970 [Chloroflexota bacterium]